MFSPTGPARAVAYLTGDGLAGLFVNRGGSTTAHSNGVRRDRVTVENIVPAARHARRAQSRSSTASAAARRLAQADRPREGGAHRNETYWGRPIPGFGDVAARILIVEPPRAWRQSASRLHRRRRRRPVTAMHGRWPMAGQPSAGRRIGAHRRQVAAAVGVPARQQASLEGATLPPYLVRSLNPRGGPRRRRARPLRLGRSLRRVRRLGAGEAEAIRPRGRATIERWTLTAATARPAERSRAY
jgi:hypothetical protein